MLPAAEPGRHKVERQLREELLGKWQSVEYFSQGMPEFDGATNILLVVSNVFVVGVRDSGEDFTAEVYGCLYLQLRDGVRQLQPQSRKIELDRDEIRFCYGPDAYSFKYQLSDKWLLLGRNSKEEVLTARLRRLTKRPEQ